MFEHKYVASFVSLPLLLSWLFSGYSKFNVIVNIKQIKEKKTTQKLQRSFFFHRWLGLGPERLEINFI